MEQRTEEWFKARLGKVTASRIADLMATTKSGYSASRKNYMAELLCQRLTGKVEEHYQNAAMQWGTDQEPFAKGAYEALKGVLVEDVAFVDHPAIPMSGASPDGLVDTDGLIEIKCPNTATHLETIITKQIDSKYIFQMQFQMSCTRRKWCDFVSYDPRLPEKLSLCVIRVPADPAAIYKIESQVKEFLKELDDMIHALVEA